MLARRLILKRYIFFGNLMKFRFSLDKNTNSQELNELKKSLQSDSIFAKVKKIFLKSDNNTKVKQDDINDILTQEKKKVNELFGFVKTNINNLPTQIDKFEKMTKLIESIQFIQKIKEHQKYSIFINDLLFLLTKSTEPREIIQIMKIIHLLKHQDFNEFWEKSLDKIKSMMSIIEFKETIDVLIIFPQKNKNRRELIEICKSELYIRMSREYYTSNRKRNLYISGEDIPIMLHFFSEIKADDISFHRQIIEFYVNNENLFENFKTSIDILKFYTNFNQEKIKDEVFNRIITRLSRNIKVMDCQNLYDIAWCLIKTQKMSDSLLMTIINSMLDYTDDKNKELNEIKLFNKNNFKLISETSVIFQKTNYEISKTLFIQIREFFLKNIHLFPLKETLNIIWSFNKLKILLNDDILINQLNEYFTRNIKFLKNDSESLIFILNFLNENVENNNKEMELLRKHVVTITNDLVFNKKNNEKKMIKFNLIIDILVYYIRIEAIDSLHYNYLLSNFKEISELNLTSCVNYLWIVSYCKCLKQEDINIILNSLLDKIISLEKGVETLKIFHQFLLINSLNYFSKNQDNPKIENIFQILEKTIIENIKNYNIIEFVSIVNCYSSRKNISEKLIYVFLEVVVNCIEQFSLVQLEIIRSSLEKFDFKNKKEILCNIEIILNKLNIEAIKKEVESLDKDFIKECIKEVIDEKEQKNKQIPETTDTKYKKLI